MLVIFNHVTSIIIIICFVDAPSFIYSPPAYMTGKRGGSISVRCEASGTPTPTLTWFKDGVALVASRKITFMQNVLRVGEHDFGSFNRLLF